MRASEFRKKFYMNDAHIKPIARGVAITLTVAACSAGYIETDAGRPHEDKLAALLAQSPDDDHRENQDTYAPLAGAPVVTSTSTASAQIPEFVWLDEEVEDDTPYVAA